MPTSEPYILDNFHNQDMSAKSMCFNYSRDSISMKPVTTLYLWRKKKMLVSMHPWRRMDMKDGRASLPFHIFTCSFQTARRDDRTPAFISCPRLPGSQSDFPQCPQHKTLFPIPWLYSKQYIRVWNRKFHVLWVSICEKTILNQWEYRLKSESKWMSMWEN